MLISVCYVNVKAAELSGMDLMKYTRERALRRLLPWTQIQRISSVCPRKQEGGKGRK